MPFTAAHPAAVIPLDRLLGERASTSALVIGSATPDVAYFVPAALDPVGSHSLGGLFAFCLPAGCALYCVFHWSIAPLVVDLAPQPIRTRLPLQWGPGRLPDRPFVWVVLSLLLGALTHIVWDSFTHATGWVVLAAPALATPLLTWHGYTVFVYKVLQHGSSLVGLSLVVWWAARYVQDTAPRACGPPPRLGIRVVLVTLLITPAAVAGTHSALSAPAGSAGGLARLQALLGSFVFSGGSAFLGALLCVAVSRTVARWLSERWT